MNYNFIKRLVICFAIGFFTVPAIFTTGCAPKRVKVVYEKDGNSEHVKKYPPGQMKKKNKKKNKWG
jgi:hypothetical protein